MSQYISTDYLQENWSRPEPENEQQQQQQQGIENADWYQAFFFFQLLSNINIM